MKGINVIKKITKIIKHCLFKQNIVYLSHFMYELLCINFLINY